MIPVVVGALAGMWIAGRGKPHTRVVKRECLGSRSGLIYQVEEFPEAGLLMLTIPGKCEAVLERGPMGGFLVRRARGTPECIEALKKDFGEAQKRVAPTEEKSS